MTRHVLIRLIESYFRHRWLYLLPIFMMMGAAGLWFFLNKPQYNSHAILYIQKESLLASLTSYGANNSTYWATPAQVTSWEINELFQTDAFIRAIIQQTDLEKKMGSGATEDAQLIKEVRKQIWSTPLGDNPLQINAIYTDPVTASQLVQGVIEVFVQWKLNASQAQTEAAESFFNNLKIDYQAELDVARQALKTFIDAHPQPLRGDRPELEQLELERLQGDVNLAATRLASVLDKEENARLAQVQTESDIQQTYVVIDAPQPPLKPEMSRRKMAMQLGIFIGVGIILSLTAIVGGALLDRSIRFPHDVTNLLFLPVLAVVPDGYHQSENSIKKSKSKKKMKDTRDENDSDELRRLETIFK